MAENMNEPCALVGDPNLDPELRARAETASAAVPVVLDAARHLRHDTLAQMHAIALHGTIIELFSACVLLAQWGEPTGIPILLRSEYEALVDLDNLVRDAGYVERMEAANIAQTLKIMKGGPLRQEFEVGRKADFDELVAQLAALEKKKKTPLSVRDRCDAVGRLGEYEGIYGMFCLDTHNNASALAERHLSEHKDGTPLISFFGPYNPQSVAMRLDFGLQWLFESADMIHSAFRVPAPQVTELADRFVRERRERMAATGNGAEMVADQPT